MLRGKKIILGVCGSIAAYKSALLVRLLVKEGAEVKVVMTTSASSFITPLTLATLSKNPVLSHFIKNDTGQWNNHVELGLWADALVIAPSSANTLAKFANGICDNLLTAVYLSARCPVFITPAMDLDMYQHPATLNNINLLRSFGNIVIDAEYGELASGLTGTGRMAEPDHIIFSLQNFFQQKRPLTGKKAMVTAGPTYEEIDPVRFIGNYSTGKMGYALAEELARFGAEVTLISGPTNLSCSNKTIKVIRVVSAEDMYQASISVFSSCDIIVLSAAVADYKPETKVMQKIKKQGNINLDLIKTRDIAQSLGRLKTDGQILIGFALETDNEIENAIKKLQKKNLDYIVLNSLNDPGAGFGHDTNKVSIIDKHNNIIIIELKPKTAIAKDIVDIIISDLAKH
ncbi:MAG: bifunctional phosphopantothenoylcysteine decarboxylase/phosphopantothenate--cysteine ligase CoaBC [Bacteroidota bacterium]|nr:bifunctional phosphopantothenoylcysteine decarboxylase/phosphopantothenate--cysteine ligase CoaBC [Bacteroidota bacterium]